MTEKEFYEQIGGNYADALSRLMKDTLIRKFVTKFPSDGSFAELTAALNEGRIDDAFRAAHTLKGVALNLAFAKLGKSAVELTERLRPGNREGVDPAVFTALYEDVKRDYEEVINAIAKLAEV